MKHLFAFSSAVLLCACCISPAVADDAIEDAAVAAGSIGFETLLRQAEQGDSEAQAELGERYARGRDVPQNFESAALWRQRAAEKGVARAENALGKQYASGLGARQDSQAALNWLLRAAEHGDPDFWFDLAVFYEQIGTDDSRSEAVNWHARAVEAGHVGAHARLGLMYYNGEGVTQDLARTAQLLGYAAERGHPRAQNNLGLMFTQGKGVEQDYEKAVALFESAAAQGLKEAYTNLGVMVENGFGVEFDEARAVDLYRQARLQGTLDGALEQIGLLADPRITIDVVTRDDLPRLLREAQQGDAISQYQSGFLLLGSGAAADYVSAIELFGKAADNGISTAMTNLGLMYFRGLGVPQDYVRGFMWVSLGATSGILPLVETRDYLAGFLTASQINQAQKWAREYRALARTEER